MRRVTVDSSGIPDRDFGEKENTVFDAGRFCKSRAVFFISSGIWYHGHTIKGACGFMKIRKTIEADLGRVMEIYAYAREFMAEHGNPRQWGANNWPPEELIYGDIKSGSSYVCLNDEGKVIGIFFYIYGQDIEPTYRKITNGNWLDNSPYGVVHRIASDGSEKGIGSFCINWAYEQCGHIRIDTHGDNVVMQGMLKKLGFIHCGTIYVDVDDDPRLAYEKSEALLNG